MKRLLLHLVIVACLSLWLCSPDQARSAQYLAPPVNRADPFTYATFPNYYAPMFQSPGKLDWNTFAGDQRGFFRDMGGWSNPYKWADSWFVPSTAAGPSVSIVAIQYTLLNNRWDTDNVSSIYDQVFRQGSIKFAPFDASLGTLNSVEVTYDLFLAATLTLSLSDEDFLAWGEGQAQGGTWLMGTVGNNPHNYDRPPTGKGAYAALVFADTGWQENNEEAVLNILHSLSESELGSGGGGTGWADAVIAIINRDESVEEWSDPPDFSKSWTRWSSEKIDSSATFTPEEYASLLSPENNLQVSFLKNDYHLLVYETGDTYDESFYASMAAGGVWVTYDYAPVPEPAATPLLALGLLGLASRRTMKPECS